MKEPPGHNLCARGPIRAVLPILLKYVKACRKSEIS